MGDESVKPPWELGRENLPPAADQIIPLNPAKQTKLHSQSKERIARRDEKHLTPKMRERRDKFIVEYLFDWNGPNAYIRAGGPATTATKMAAQYLKEPYVLQKIKETVDALEEAQLINRQRILAGLVREAHYHGIGASHGARVSAWAKLASIKGMDAPLKIEGKFAHGVMMVPMAKNRDEWERIAEEAQKQLKEEVKK